MLQDIIIEITETETVDHKYLYSKISPVYTSCELNIFYEKLKSLCVLLGKLTSSTMYTFSVKCALFLPLFITGTHFTCTTVI